MIGAKREDSPCSQRIVFTVPPPANAVPRNIVTNRSVKLGIVNITPPKNKDL